MDPIIPVNYFPDDDPTKEPIVNWRAAGQLCGQTGLTIMYTRQHLTILMR